MAQLKKSLQAFSFLQAPQSLAVGVSGGPDSMALCHSLQVCFGKTHGLTPLIVNHNLRPEAPLEAQRVATWLYTMGLNPVILTWEGDKPSAALQEKARHKRHKLLKEWCFDHNVPTLCLGHHADDQQETQMMRLLGGSYLPGMAGMANINYEPFGRLIRPFLDVPKATLVAYCNEQAIPFIQDPSNISPRFLRTHLRNLKHQHPSFFQFPKIEFNQVMQDWLGRFFWNHIIFLQNQVQIPTKLFFSLPFTFQQEIIVYLVMTWGTVKPYPPRRRSIQLLLKRLTLGQNSSLQGLEFSPKKTYVLMKTA